MTAKIDQRVLIHFPGTAGNLPFYFGVMDYVQHHVDFSQLAFLTRSGSGFPVATAINGVDCKSCLRNWQVRVRSYFHETKDTTLTNTNLSTIDHSKLTLVNGLSNNRIVPHHIETLTPPLFDRHWVSSWNTMDDYINSLVTSCHIPFAFNHSLTRNGHLDGAMHIPILTRSFGVTNKVTYRDSILIEFAGFTYKGAVKGLFSPDDYVNQSNMEYQQGLDYASNVLRRKLEDLDVIIKEKPRIPPDNSNVLKWDTRTNRYMVGVPPIIYHGPWWMSLQSRL